MNKTPPAAPGGAAHDPCAEHLRARPVAATFSLLLPLGVVLAVATVLVGLVLAALRWALATEDGTRWVLQRTPYVSASGWQGALLGGQWRASQLRIQWQGGRAGLTLDDVQADGVELRMRPADAPGSWLAVHATRLQARSGTLNTGTHGDKPLTLPASLALPLQVHVDTVTLQSLAIDTLAPLTDMRVDRLALDSRPGAQHTIDSFTLQWHGWAATGRAQLGHAAPMPLQASVSITPAAEAAAPGWAAVLQASGPLARVDLQGALRGVPRTNRPAPALDLQALVLPQQTGMLSSLQLKTSNLDLAALHTAAPQTQLNGSATLTSRAMNAPLSASVQLDNAQPGRWNEGRLPVARLLLDVAGRLDQLQRVEAPHFEVWLAEGSSTAASGTAPAGKLTGSAQWRGHSLQLDTRLVDVAPQRLDSRAAAMRVSGPLALTIDGLPSPDRDATSATPPWRAEWLLDLEGRLDTTPQPVQLKLQGTADAQRVLLQQARAQTGAAVADLSGSLQKLPRGDWQLSSAGALAGFDPLPWFPGEPGSAWRQGPHRLSGSWKFDVRLPADALALARTAPLALLQRVAGNGNLRVADAVLAGVPLQAEAVLTHAPTAPAARPGAAGAPAANSGAVTLHADLRMAGNTLVVDGKGDPAGSGSGDRWRAELKAEHLANLATLAKLHPALAEWVPHKGTATLTLAADGRWPQLRTEGSARAQQLQLGSWALARGQADWLLDSRESQPLSMTLDLAGLQRGKQRADQLRGTVLGTLEAHRIDIEALLPVSPSGASAQLLATPATGTRAQLRAQGGWMAQAGGGGRWRTQVERLLVAGWDRSVALPVSTGSPAAAPPSTATTPGASVSPLAVQRSGSTEAPWAEASDLRGELLFDGTGALKTLTAQPGRLRLADTATLRWDDIRLDFGAAAPRIDLRADVEAFALAPLLARLQPDMAWQGDLRVAGRVVVQAAERFDADVLLDRVSGDLRLAGADTPQAMGLAGLRLALSAHDGLWTFKSELVGQTLGELRGTVQARTTPSARWPAPDAALDGQLQLRVADIGIWNAWIPPGWRMVGSVQGMAALSGRFNDPRYTGELTGSKLGLRNLLQGVNVGDGEVTVRLDGDTARIDRFALRAGEGTLTVGGTAVLGNKPEARLQLKAERFRVLGRVDRQLIASGQAEMVLAANSLKLDGRVVADEGLFDASKSNAPSLDDDVSVRRQSADDLPAAEFAAQRQRSSWLVAVDLGVDLGEKLRVRGHGLDTVLEGRLRLTTPGSRLALSGSINAVGGTYAAYGQKLSIERGIIAFNGPPDSARLDVLALRPNIDTRAGVSITGNWMTPRVRLYSDPDLTDNEKLSWLVLGRAPAGLGRNDTALLQRAAVALLAGEGEAPTDALLRNLGIDELSLRQTDGDVRETVISLGKQLSRRWYVGYERGVNSTTGTWQLIYRIAQRFTLRAQSGLENSLDVIWVWRLGETPAQAPAGAVRKLIPLPP